MDETQNKKIRMNEEDRLNFAAVKSQMVKAGMPESSIGTSDVFRFALSVTAKKAVK